MSLPLVPATDPPAAVDREGVQSKHRARQFVTKLCVSDCKSNFQLATCLYDNGSEVNLRSDSFLPDERVFDLPHLVTLEGVLDTLSQMDNAVVINQPIWSLSTFGMPAKWRKLSLRMTTSVVPK